MNKKLRIGIIGCGAIGGSLAKAVVREFRAQAILAALYDLEQSKCEELSKLVAGSKRLSVSSRKVLFARSDLVIEAASAKISWEVAREAVSRGKDIMLMSVGGIIGKIRELKQLAAKNQAKVYIPSGAIAGIDALRAAQEGGIKSVTLSTRKNPLSFSGVEYVQKKGIDLAQIKRDTVLFSGPARTAVKFFPQNINVAAILSLGGIGEHKTIVEIIASPAVKNNIHEIVIESESGKIITRTENKLHPDNPKTSALAVLSAKAVLRRIFDPVKVGT